jgi:hypothetical protein
MNRKGTESTNICVGVENSRKLASLHRVEMFTTQPDLARIPTALKSTTVVGDDCSCSEYVPKRLTSDVSVEEGSPYDITVLGQAHVAIFNVHVMGLSPVTLMAGVTGDTYCEVLLWTVKETSLVELSRTDACRDTVAYTTAVLGPASVVTTTGRLVKPWVASGMVFDREHWRDESEKPEIEVQGSPPTVTDEGTRPVLAARNAPRTTILASSSAVVGDIVKTRGACLAWILTDSGTACPRKVIETGRNTVAEPAGLPASASYVQL